MLIIINDDRAYISWISRHRYGFVVDAQRKLNHHHFVLHRAVCSLIRPHPRAKLTTGAHFKACSLDVLELKDWSHGQSGGELTACRVCHPHDEATASNERARDALTPLGRETLSYVLDLAVMYLDGQEADFGPTLEDIARYLGKTVAQVAPAVRRLMDGGYLETAARNDAPLLCDVVATPTDKALRTIPAFASLPAEELAIELARLKRGN